MSVIRLVWACVTAGFLLAMLAATAAVLGIARHELGADHALLGRLAWATLLAVGAAGALVVLALRWVQRWATRPLEGFEEQIRALAERRFVSMNQPGVAEWVQLSKALNVLVARVGLMLDEKDARLQGLRAEMEHDALTGVASRGLLMERLKQQLAEPEDSGSPGAMAIVRLHDLVGMNQRVGRERTDDFLRAVATSLRTRLVPHEGRGALLARLNGSDFGLLLPGVDEALLYKVLTQIAEQLDALHDDRIAESWHVGWIGATTWRAGEPLSDVMTRADAMVMAAETRRERHCMTTPSEPLHLVTVAQWRLMIEDALATGRVQLAYFPVMASAPNGADALLHREAMLRLQGPDGALLPAHAFIPPAIRTGRVLDLDLRAIELALAELARTPGDIAVNIAAHSMRRPIFQRRLRDVLARQAHLAPRLWIEVDEAGLSETPDELRRFAEMLRPFGCKLGIEHFGHYAAALPKLERTGLHYLKLDRAFCVGAHDHPGRQALVRVVVELGEALGMCVIAEGLNDERDWRALERLGVAGATGPWVSKRRVAQPA